MVGTRCDIDVGEGARLTQVFVLEISKYSKKIESSPMWTVK